MKIALVGAECEENLALRYIRAALEARACKVDQIVFNSEGDTEVAARQLAESGAPLAGFSMVFTYRAGEFARLAHRSRELGFRGHLVAGGHFAAFNAESLLHDVPAFDSVAIGEGEELMVNLARNLRNLPAVRGLVWRDPSGIVHRNAPAEKPPELDQLPPPSRLEPPDTYLGLPVANMLSSRGCTHRCAFCSIAAWHKLCGGPRFRLRDPAAVADEMADLYARGYRFFNFHDDNFFLEDKRQSLQRFWRLRGELQRRGVARIAFAVKSRPDTVDKEVFAFLKDFGLFRVFLGIEAGTAESLRRLGRGQSLDDNERALEIVNRLELHACFNLLLLNPDSTLEDFRANTAFLRAHAGNPLNFCRTEVYSGTPLEAKLRREGRLQGDYWGYGYRIADPRAQAVFELMYVGLAGRHFGDHCVHHLTMQVDFERQVLDHFWGCPPDLRRRAKDFVRRVNLSSCDYLGELADAAAAGFASATAREAFLRQVSARVRRDNQRFTEEGRRLVAEIESAAQPKARRTGMFQQEAGVVLASSLVLLPISSVTSQNVVDPPPPPITTLAEKHKAILLEKLLATIAPSLPDNDPLRVRIVFDEKGRWSSGEVFNLARQRTLVYPLDAVKEIELPELKNTLCETTFTRKEVAQARPKSAMLLNLRRELGPDFMSALVADLKAPVDADVKVEIDQAGRVAKIEILKLVPGQTSAVVADPTNVKVAVKKVKISDETLRAKPWTIRYTRAELQRWQNGTHPQERPPVPPTHIFEMAPRPAPGPPAQIHRESPINVPPLFCEMAPVPPREKDK